MQCNATYMLQRVSQVIKQFISLKTKYTYENIHTHFEFYNRRFIETFII